MTRGVRARYRSPDRLIHFVAKTGFITKDLWKDFFFKGGTVQWQNVSWNNLIKRKYFKRHASSRYQDILILRKDSVLLRDCLLSAPVSVPHISQVAHDEYLSRGLLQLLKERPNLNWQTEAELKKQKPMSCRVSNNGEKTKYPDLIINVAEESVDINIAIELERTLKSQKRYIQILDAYTCSEETDYILFLVGSNLIKKTIMEIMRLSYFPTKRVQVVFAFEREWLTNAPLLINRIVERAKKQEQLKAA